MTKTSQFLIPLLLALCLSGCATSGKDAAGEKDKIDQLQQDLVIAGDKAASQGQMDSAVTLYLEAARLGNTAEHWYRVGYAYQRLNNWSKAAKAYQRVCQLEPDKPRGWEALGQVYLNNRQIEDAAGYFQNAIALDPTLWRSHNGLGVAADLAGDSATAFSHYEAALAIKDDSPMLWTNFGYSNYLAGNYPKARECFDNALKLDANYKAAWANLGLIEARQGNYSKSLKILTRIQEEPVAYNDIGYIAMLNEDWDEAEFLLNQALEKAPYYYENANDNLKRLRIKRDQRTLNRLEGKNAPVSNPPPSKTSDQTLSAKKSLAASKTNESPDAGTHEIKPTIASSVASVEKESVNIIETNVRTNTPQSRDEDSSEMLDLSRCANSSWPSACRICALTRDPDTCMEESLSALNKNRK